MSRYSIALCITAFVASLPGARLASAADITSNPPAEAVQIYGSELASSAGVARVHARLTGAARDVCHGLDGRDIERQMRYRRCVAESLERAVRDVHDSRLTAYHQAHTGAPRTVALVAGSPGAAR